MGAPRLTPAQVETIKRVWLETANASEAAREAGCSHQSALRCVVRHGMDSSGRLYADALARAEREHLALVAKGRRRLSEALDASDADVAELARAANDSLRAVTATRIAHLKAAGLSAPDRADVTSGGEKIATVVMLPPLDATPPNVSTANDSGSVATEPGASD